MMKKTKMLQCLIQTDEVMRCWKTAADDIIGTLLHVIFFPVYDLWGYGWE